MLNELFYSTLEISGRKKTQKLKKCGKQKANL